MDHVVAVVLAGGRATRMGGGDKTLLRIGRRTMLSSILDALRPLPVAISANGDPERFAEYGLPILADGPFIDQGPLAGVLAGLDWAVEQGATALLTVPGDTPMIPRDLASRLWPPPACAASLGQAHTLVALWPVAARDSLRAWLEVPGPRHAARFATRIGMREVAFAAETWDPFVNVNSPADLDRLKEMRGSA